MLPDATHIAKALGDAGVQAEIEQSGLGLLVMVDLPDVRAALTALKTDGFGFLLDLFGTDTGEDLHVTYHLRSFSRDAELFVRAHVPYEGTLPSVWEVMPAAAFPEREAAELFGMRLSGHPNPRRLLTTEGCPPYLRKDVPVRTAEEVRLR